MKLKYKDLFSPQNKKPSHQLFLQKQDLDYQRRNQTIKDKLARQAHERHQRTLSNRNFLFTQMQQKEQLQKSEEKEKQVDLFAEKKLKMSFEQNENERNQMRKLLLQQNQGFLVTQMAERTEQEVNDCKMHRTDMLLNNSLLKNLEDEVPVLAHRSRRKPF